MPTQMKIWCCTGRTGMSLWAQTTGSPSLSSSSRSFTRHLVWLSTAAQVGKTFRQSKVETSLIRSALPEIFPPRSLRSHPSECPRAGFCFKPQAGTIGCSSTLHCGVTSSSSCCRRISQPPSWSCCPGFLSGSIAELCQPASHWVKPSKLSFHFSFIHQRF